MLENQPDLYLQVKEYNKQNENKVYILAENVTLGIFKDNQIFTRVVMTDDLS